jgi:Cytochrome b5-like Heme/Steroid binding domain/Eukaryotic cytochrome b561
MYVNSDGTSGGSNTPVNSGFSIERATNIHGLLMWASWSLLGLVQIITNRYLRHKFKWSKRIHMISGSLLCASVITGFMFIFKVVLGGEIDLDSVHTILGNLVVLTGTLVTLGGFLTQFVLGFSNMQWKTNVALLIRGTHSKFAYATLLVSQAAIMTGVFLHFSFTNPQLARTLVTCNLGAYITVLGLFEACYRLMLSKEDPFRKVDQSMTIAEFEEAVKAGKKYVVLDEYVLDVEPFLAYHPGGKFVLSHNIGMDVSKFFHGGYSLEGNSGPRPASGYKHSNQARKVVNQLIIARLDASTEVQTTVCFVD